MNQARSTILTTAAFLVWIGLPITVLCLGPDTEKKPAAPLAANLTPKFTGKFVAIIRESVDHETKTVHMTAREITVKDGYIVSVTKPKDEEEEEKP